MAESKAIPGEFADIAISGGRLVAADGKAMHVFSVDENASDILSQHTIELSKPPLDISLFSKGEFAFAFGRDNLTVWNLSDMSKNSLSTNVVEIRTNANASENVSAVGLTNEWDILRWANFRRLDSPIPVKISHPKKPIRCQLLGRGELLWAEYSESDPRIWDTSTGEESTIKVERPSPGSKLIAVEANEGEVACVHWTDDWKSLIQLQ